MKNVQDNQFYTEMQNVMPTHKEENILNISKQQALAAFATCVLKDENRNMLLSKIYIKACRYHFSRFHSSFSHGPRYKTKF